jgi:cytochrome c biogenesis protein CcmG, thiol:disulfide interchange protein DsbE
VSPFLHAILLAALLLVGCGAENPKLAKGAPPPGFTLPRLAGGSARFPEDYQGQVVVIRFWADWCPFCKGEMTALEPVYQRLRDQGLHILAVNVRQDAQTAGDFVRTLGIGYETPLDAHGEVARAYGVQGLPTTFFVGRDGTLHSRILGESTPELTERLITELLGKGP